MSSKPLKVRPVNSSLGKGITAYLPVVLKVEVDGSTYAADIARPCPTRTNNLIIRGVLVLQFTSDGNGGINGFGTKSRTVKCNETVLVRIGGEIARVGLRDGVILHRAILDAAGIPEYI